MIWSSKLLTQVQSGQMKIPLCALLEMQFNDNPESLNNVEEHKKTLSRAFSNDQIMESPSQIN